MGGKQLADVLLSTSRELGLNDVSPFIILNLDNTPELPSIFTYRDDLGVMALDGREEELRRLFFAITDVYPEDSPAMLARYNSFKDKLHEILAIGLVHQDYYLLAPDDYMGLFGMGMLDTGKAVGGPGYFNAGRLNEDSDLSSGQYGGDFALYRVDTLGFAAQCF